MTGKKWMFTIFIWIYTMFDLNNKIEPNCTYKPHWPIIKHKHPLKISVCSCLQLAIMYHLKETGFYEELEETINSWVTHQFEIFREILQISWETISAIILIDNSEWIVQMF